MKKRITILANTKRKGDGVCIAGIDQDGSWIRPVKVDGNYLEKKDLFSGNNVIIDTFYEVDIVLDRYIPNPPNTEDYKISDDTKPELVRKILTDNERLKFLDKFVDPCVEDIFNGGKRALGLVQCKEIINVEAGWCSDGKFYNTITFKDNSSKEYTLSVTDLRWAAFKKHFIKSNNLQSIQLNNREIIKLCKPESIFFSLGLARETDMKMKELIIGVFTIPDYAECKNFQDLQLMEKSINVAV